MIDSIRSKTILHFALATSVSIALIGCDSATDDAYSSLEAGGNGSSANCEIKSSFPSEKTIRVSSAAGTLTNFSVTPNVSTCRISYRINGQAVDTTVTGGSVNIDSNLLTVGDNIIEATAANDFTQATTSWTVKKNSPPSCVAQVPASEGNSMSIPGTISLTANATDSNNDNLTFNWMLNGRSAGSSFSGLISSSSASTITYTPAASMIGANRVAATIYDGYDYGSCEWNVNVTGDCGIASSSPSGTIIRVPNNGSAQSTFAVNTNTPGCAATWTLNGVSIPGTTTSNQIQSSVLNAGNNILTLTMGSGSSAVTRTWMVVKNSPPICQGQTPTNTSTFLTGVGVPKTLVATGEDANGDNLTFSWTINGNSAGSIIATSATNTAGTGIYIGTSNQVGTNTIAALMDDGYDTNSCTWTTTTVDSCVVTSNLPSPSNVRISSSGLPINFSVVPNDVNCNVTWKINGVDLGSGSFVDLYPSNTNLLAAPSTNTVMASLNNGIHGTTVKSWTVLRNTPPSCLSPTPNSYTGNTLAIPASMNFGMVASDANSDPLTFTWKVNGVAGAPSLGTPTSGGNASIISFTPSGPNIGNNIIALDVSDGYDLAQCSWSVNVSGDCAVTSESPSTSGQTRVPALPTSLNTFSLTTTTSGCGANWTLNGLPIAGTSLTQQIQSSQLLSGANSLAATVPNGIYSTTKTWIILKNSVPTCTPTPSNLGAVLAGKTVAKTFTAAANDSDGDSVTFSWLYNNASPGSLISSSSSGNTGTGIYTGTNATLGAGTVTAVMNDGFDSSRCDWEVTTVDACSVTSSLPSSSSLRLPAFGGVQTFGIVPNNSACQIEWTLNGSSIGSGNFFDLYSANSTLITGSNTVEATISNGIHTGVTRSWTVVKNNPPACSGTTPSTPIDLNYGTPQALVGNFANADDDTLTYSWALDGGSPSLFSALSSSSGTHTGTANATLTPVYSTIGTGHSATVTASDGYDNGSCAWTVNVQDPSQVQITSCLPAENPAVVYSQGSNSTRLFTVSATGPSLSYQWKIDGANVGANSSTHSMTAASLSVGNHSAKVTVTDQYGNSQECNWTVKRNAAPSISSFTPDATNAIKLNVANTLPLSITATDANSDGLSYTWTVNGGVNNAVLPSTLTTSAFNPAGNNAFLGANTLTVSVSDGYESTTQSWTVEGNYFSDVCNSLYNGPVTGTGATGGKICTLIGHAGVGSTLDPTADQSLIKIQPAYVIDDGSNNLIFSDLHSHAVFYYNRSASAFTKFGKLIPAGRMVAILGNGMNGKNDELSYNTDYKLSTPLGLAYDSNNEKLFIADNGNHRVVMLNSSGQAVTVFGTGGSTQNSTTNADGLTGTQLVCQGPQALQIIGTSLYITCYNTSAIKKMDINPASPSYLKGYMVVGPLNASNAVISGNSDGTPGTSGLARANGPLGLATDGDGNLYWTDYGSGRVRMLNLSGSTKSFFPNKSVSANFNIGMADLSTTALTSPSNVTTNAAYSITTPNLLYVWGPSTVTTNTCVHYRVQSRAATTPSPAQANITVNLTNGGIGTFYSDSSCASTTTTTTIMSGFSEADFYYKRASGTGAVTFTASGLTTNGTLAVNVAAAGGTATKLALFGPNSFNYDGCTKLMLQVQDASSLPTTSATNRTILLANDNTGNFYADSACSSTPVNSLTLTAGTTREAYVYFAKTAIAPAGQVVSLFGNSNSQLYAAGGWSSVTIRFPRDLLVDYTGSTVKGFLVTTNNTTANDSHHRLVYVNNTTSDQTFGGVTASAFNQGVIPGANHGGVAIAGISSAGYNGDGQTGLLTKLYYPWGITYDSTKNNILIADSSNYRIRTFDITGSNGNVNTAVGFGRLRSGFISDSSVAATDSIFNSPSNLVFDSSARLMYLADSGNGRIRKIDMLRGQMETIVGRGIGDGNIETEDPLYVYTRSVRGLALITSDSNKYLIFVDNQATTGINTTCLVRAYNMGTTSGTIFGVTIPANRVSTLAGDFNLGCGTFSGAGSGTSRTLNRPENIVYDGTNLYISVYNDHCVLKLDPSGNLTRFMGTCGTAGNIDGFTPDSGSTALSRFPMGIASDISRLGNIFISDQYDQNTGRIKYINASGSSVSVGGTTVLANTAGNSSRTQTLWNLIPQGGGASRINSIATFENLVCWAAGYTGNGNDGPHAIYCGDKTTGNVTRVAGPSEQSSNYVRGGAPLGEEQEGIPGVSAYLAAPYGLTFDTDGNLYIVERSTHTVRFLRRWF